MLDAGSEVFLVLLLPVLQQEKPALENFSPLLRLLTGKWSPLAVPHNNCDPTLHCLPHPKTSLRSISLNRKTGLIHDSDYVELSFALPPFPNHGIETVKGGKGNRDVL